MATFARRSTHRWLSSWTSRLKERPQEAFQQLALFPELAQSSEARQEHQYARAVAPLKRMLEVCESMAAAQPALAVEAAWQLGQVHARLGQVDDAVKFFRRDPVYGLDQAIRTLLVHGDADKAVALLGSNEKQALEPTSAELYGQIAQYIKEGTLSALSSPSLENADSVELANAAALMVAQSSVKFTAESSSLTALSDDDEALFQQAETLWLRATEVAGATDKENELWTAWSWANLGELYLAQGRDEDALNILGKALKVQEKRPEEPLHLARTLGLIAMGYHRLGQAVTSEGLFATSLETFQAHQSHLNRVETLVHGKTLIGYGRLLEQWDKREADGANRVAAGQQVLGTQPLSYWLPLFIL
ncbi:hypothetical protein LEN26_003827 [Aphanomyces euteiches]|nr:hypothetical protein AeMF1_006888 [Aphanomyces euteiches]KAH9151666.1 hypothetical protein LEN26_003827 [Aphanomyces euteiches]KAH9182153.1 hypothetical protein AeNC1_015873 [Aphanomyces euteiches]